MPWGGGSRSVQQLCMGLTGQCAGLAHLNNGPSRPGLWTSNDWLGMAHKPGGLVVPMDRADEPCRRAVLAGWPILNFVL